jgi:hypothetical protein
MIFFSIPTYTAIRIILVRDRVVPKPCARAFYLFCQLCRRIQARSQSEDFQRHVATAADAPLSEPPASGSSNGAYASGAGRGKRTGSDFRQPLMHDDEDARNTLVRSRVLFEHEQPPPPASEFR